MFTLEAIQIHKTEGKKLELISIKRQFKIENNYFYIPIQKNHKQNTYMYIKYSYFTKFKNK